MANLVVEAERGQDADADVGTVPREIVGLTAIEEIGGDSPVIRVDPFSMAGAAQSLKSADVGANEGLGIAADAVAAVKKAKNGRGRPPRQRTPPKGQ
jgi:hypothetical protein